MWPHFDLKPRLEGLPPFETLTCLDLGCGAYASVVAEQVLTISWKKLTSIEGYQPNVDKAGEKKAEAKEWELKTGDVREVKTKADVVLSFDVLEHLTKEEGLKWLEDIEKLAKVRIVLFFPVEPDDFHRDVKFTADAENVLEEHLSHWKAFELQRLGYKVWEVNDCHSEIRPDGSTITFGAVWATKDL